MRRLGVAGRADGDSERRRKLVVVDALDEPIDDLGGTVIVRIEEHHREGALVAGAEDVGIPDLEPEDPRDFADGPLVGGDHETVPFPFGFNDEQGQIVLRSHRTLEFGIEHELKRERGQQACAVFVESFSGHGDYDALSRPLSLIL